MEQFIIKMKISEWVNRKIWPVLLGLTVFALCSSPVIRHIQTDRNAVPWMDGSQHFSNAANLMNLIFSGEISAHWSFFQGLFPLLSVYTLYIFSFFLTAGKTFYSLGILFSLLFLFLIFMFQKNNSDSADSIMKTSVFTVMVFFSGLLFSENGGFLDTRIDVVSALFGGLSLLAAVNTRYYQSFLFCIIASLMKGAAFFLIFPQIFLIAFFIEWKAGFRSVFKRNLTEMKVNFQTIGKYSILLILFFLFLRYSFLESLSYNLMKTGGAGLTERILIFQKTMTQYLSAGVPFYIAHLLKESNAVHLSFSLLFLLQC